MSPTATVKDRARPTGPDEPAGVVHQAALERALGRVFSMLVALIVAGFWFSSAIRTGPWPGNVATDLLLNVLLGWQALRARRRPPSQRDLHLLAVATTALLLASRTLGRAKARFLTRRPTGS